MLKFINLILILILLSIKTFAIDNNTQDIYMSYKKDLFSNAFFVKDNSLSFLIDKYIAEVVSKSEYKLIRLRIIKHNNSVEVWFKTPCYFYDLFEIPDLKTKIIYHKGYIVYATIKGENTDFIENLFQKIIIPNSFLKIKQPDKKFVEIDGEDDSCCEHDYNFVYINNKLYEYYKQPICD